MDINLILFILKQDLISNLDSKCHYIKTNGDFLKEKVLTNIFIDCENFKFQVSIVYNRAKFLWIGSSDEYKDESIYFGDTPRALTNFELATIVDQNEILFKIPSDIKKILFDYGHSKFLECNSELAEMNLQKIGDTYKQNEKMNKMIENTTEHVIETLENFEKHYWLAGGTLLGWYRDCGIIPHTKDFDIAIWSHEYDSQIEKHFFGNKIVRVIISLGMVSIYLF